MCDVMSDVNKSWINGLAVHVWVASGRNEKNSNSLIN